MAVKKSKSLFNLRDHQEAVEVAASELPPVCVAFGDSEHLRAAAVEQLRRAWLGRYPDGDTVIYRGAGDTRPPSLAELVRELAGGSLFAKEKLVVVRQADRVLFLQSGRAGGDAGEGAGAGSASEREKSFLAYLDAPSNKIWLLVETSQLPRNRNLGKKLATAAFVIPCPAPTPRELPPWLRSRAARWGKTIDDEAAEMLILAHGADLGALDREIEKLSLFAEKADRIGTGIVGEFMTGTVEFDVFSLTNAIEERNPAKALYFARRITEQGTRDQKGKKEDGEKSAHRSLSILAGTVQGLLRARVALAERLGATEFASAEKLSPWRAGKLLDAAARFSLPELRRMNRYAADQLRRVHDTGGDPLLALETMTAVFVSSVDSGINARVVRRSAH